MYVLLVLGWMGSVGCWWFSNLKWLSMSRARYLIAVR